MERLKEHYCWIKVVGAAEAAPVADDVDPDGGLLLDSGEASVEAVPTAAPRPDSLEGELMAHDDISFAGPRPPPAPAPFTGLRPPPAPFTGLRPPPASFAIPDTGLRPPPAPPMLLAVPDTGLRPPPAPERFGSTDDRSAADPNRNLRILMDEARVRHFAGATFAGAWHVDQGTSAQGHRVELRPVLGGREMAIAWIDSVEGCAWRRDAQDYTLVCFTAIGDL